jgi:3',5'-cyclic AMP phosphodiesterase CpdA
MTITRANLLRGAFAASALLPATALAATQSPQSFRADLGPDSAHPWNSVPQIGGAPLRFAVIGDNTGMARPGVFEQAMVQLSWLQPDFVLSVGDMVEGYTNDRARIDQDWARVEAATAKLGCPIVYTPGNHDMNTIASREAHRHWRGEATYYSFTYKGALFLILSTEEPDDPYGLSAQMGLSSGTFYHDYWTTIDAVRADPASADKIMRQFETTYGMSALLEDSKLIGQCSFGDRQMRWIADTLAKNPAPQWTFVVLHRPVWKNHNPDFKKIQAMLQGRAHTVFAGHTHYFTHEVIDGHDYINMGTTGGIRVKEGPGTLDHTMLVTLAPSGPLYANTRFTGLMNAAGETGQIYAY